jgi:hypothetical protein
MDLPKVDGERGPTRIPSVEIALMIKGIVIFVIGSRKGANESTRIAETRAYELYFDRICP